MLKLNTLRAASIAALGTLLCLMTSGVVCGQNIVKWVDAQGQIHYSDHAPAGQDTEAVSVRVSRPRPASAVPVAPSNVAAVSRSTADSATAAKDTTAAREAEEQQRRSETQEAAEAAKAQSDKDLVAKCNQAHEIYCNQGADTIRQRETTRAEIQYNDAISARQDRISRGLRPGVLPPPPP